MGHDAYRPMHSDSEGQSISKKLPRTAQENSSKGMLCVRKDKCLGYTVAGLCECYTRDRQ